MSKLKSGNSVDVIAGKDGGNKLDVSFPTIADQESLQTIADNIYRSKIYTGYEGSFDAWLVPYCDAGYLITLEDATKSLMQGKYYVTAVVVEFSSSGAKRSVSLGSSLNMD